MRVYSDLNVKFEDWFQMYKNQCCSMNSKCTVIIHSACITNRLFFLTVYCHSQVQVQSTKLLFQNLRTWIKIRGKNMIHRREQEHCGTVCSIRVTGAWIHVWLCAVVCNVDNDVSIYCGLSASREQKYAYWIQKEYDTCPWFLLCLHTKNVSLYRIAPLCSVVK